MKLTPKETDKLQLYQVGQIAQRRLAMGIQLNKIEATGLICLVLLELVRLGDHDVSSLMNLGKSILGKKHVIKEVLLDLKEIQLEATFKDGTFLITIHEPIATIVGDLKLALIGSFLPVPDDSMFIYKEPKLDYQIGEDEVFNFPFILKKDLIEVNKGRNKIILSVSNLGDRPIQVGSHYPFCEVNGYLKFDRLKSKGYRLDILSGTSIRFEPGDTRKVQLVEFSGDKISKGGNNINETKDLNASKLKEMGFYHQDEDINNQNIQPVKVDRFTYCNMYGPTAGDKVILNFSNLIIEIEKDYTIYGEETKFGGGKIVRDGQAQTNNIKYINKESDLIITNIIIIDYNKIIKADIGIKDGYIIGIGKSGNPDICDNIDIICGTNTEILAGEGMILTAGAIDTHIHFICPQLFDEAIANGITTLIGGGTGPNTGTKATTCTPGKNNLKMMYLSTDDIPLNLGFTGKGNSSDEIGLKKQIEYGAIGLKLHEDWGSTPSCINSCLNVCDQYDVQCTIHTDTLNESGFVESTIKSINNRTIHTYHTEGAGGGHAPDILKVCSLSHVIPSSTNPTRPYTTNTLEEHLDMLMVCHHLDKRIPEDVAFAESRIRAETIAAEDILHDLGAISIISSDSQAMGRIGETVSRTWKTAHKMKAQRGHLEPNDEYCNQLGDKMDNFRVKRYVAKYTINPAIAHGISNLVGSVEVNKLADLIIYKPNEFGIKCEYVIKAGQIIYSQMGDANASIPTTQPVIGRRMFCSSKINSFLLVSKYSMDNKVLNDLNLNKRLYAVTNCREISKKDMKLNNYCPNIKIDPETYNVSIDNQLCTCEPAGYDVGLELPANQAHYLF